jgi:peptide deformylase
MAVRTVLYHPHPVLRDVAAPVGAFDSELKDLVSDMFETMDDYRGVGLAAPQVGISLRLLVVSYKKNRFEIVNPEIVSASGEAWDEEGCLSLPGVTLDMKRYARIHVRGFSAVGRPVAMREKGFLARILQHEIDHLNGVLIIDNGLPVAPEIESE